MAKGIIVEQNNATITGSVNLPVKTALYTGKETDTATVNVDNYEKTISVDVNVSNVTKNSATKAELREVSNSKQDTLVSGTNIKTINGNNVLGSGNIAIEINYPVTDVTVDGSSVLDGTVAKITLPTVPTDISAFNNDAGYITSSYHDSTKQDVIDSSHKLSSDLVDDTEHTNKFVTASDKTNWNAKQEALVSGENIKTINSQSLLGEGNISIESSQTLVETTWSELKELRDNDELISGCFYRITDYQCTTIQYNTSSATNQFDIIVRADGVNKLSEDAYAINHESNESGYEDYFANSNLSAWKLKYCLNNDLSRFAWARTNGIVVNNSNYYRYNDYYDDVGASHPYCWLKNNNKNYKFWTDTESVSVGDAVYSNSNSATPTSTVISIIEEGKGVIYWMKDEFNNEAPYDFKNFLYTTTSAYGNYTNAYTFSYTENDELKDASLLKDKKCCNNVIKSNGGTVLIVSDTTTFNSYNNVFEKECANVILKSGCSRNIFKMNCMNIQFGANCTGNFISSYCQNSVFGNSCVYNIIGNHNFFEFGNNCEGNITGNVCTVNLGNYCSYNKVGNHCAFTLGTSSSNKINYCRYITVDNGCRYLYINSEDTASSSKYLQNIHIHSGTYGTSTGTTTTYKTVVVSRNLSYTTDVYATGSTEIFI